MDNAVLDRIVATVRQRLPGARPRCALVLGSGWGAVAEAFPTLETVPYEDIPDLGGTRVAGHSGRLVLARSGETFELLIFQGRRHWYEGAGWEPVAAPIAIAAASGASAVVLTNAAGGIRDDLVPGALMVIDDHINAMGVSPLAGPHDPRWGTRFPDQTEVYDAGLRRLLDRAGDEDGRAPAHGVYLAAAGPAYETPAEIAAFRGMGADAVGMSTVPEAMLANAAGLRVAAVSCITNHAAGIAGRPLRHEDVIAETRRAETRMAGLVERFFKRLANEETD